MAPNQPQQGVMRHDGWSLHICITSQPQNMLKTYAEKQSQGHSCFRVACDGVRSLSNHPNFSSISPQSAVALVRNGSYSPTLYALNTVSGSSESKSERMLRSSPASQ